MIKSYNKQMHSKLKTYINLINSLNKYHYNDYNVIKLFTNHCIFLGDFKSKALSIQSYKWHLFSLSLWNC